MSRYTSTNLTGSESVDITEIISSSNEFECYTSTNLTGSESVDITENISSSNEFECAEKFRYLWSVIGSRGVAEESSRARLCHAY